LYKATNVRLSTAVMHLGKEHSCRCSLISIGRYYQRQLRPLSHTPTEERCCVLRLSSLGCSVMTVQFLHADRCSVMSRFQIIFLHVQNENLK